MTRNLLLSALAVLFIFNETFGQDVARHRKIDFGIWGGLPVLGKFDSNDHLRSASGLTLGINVGYYFRQPRQGLSIHLQPNWSEQSVAKKSGINTAFFQKATWTSQSVNIPVLLRWTFSTGNIRPFLEFGPNLRFRTALSQRNEGKTCGVSNCSNYDATIRMQSEISQDRIGLTAGAGVELDIWKLTIPVGVRIVEGIGTYKMNIVREDSYYYQGLKTRGIQIVTGISF
jgi:hypothetical protein